MEQLTTTVNRAREAPNVPADETTKERTDALTVDKFAMLGLIITAMIYEDLASE